MRILVVTTHYSPDLGPSAPIFTMLCEDLVKLDHQVSLIAAVPHYPTGRVPPEFRGRLFQREIANGVDVTRVYVPSVDRSKLWQRALVFATFQLLATLAGLRRRYDVAIISNPALEVGLPFLVLGPLRGKPAVFSVYDLYPDVGVRLGIFRNQTVTSLVAALEKCCLRSAARVSVLSAGFRESLRKQGIPDSRIQLIGLSTDTDFIRPLPQDNAFSRERGLNGRFVVLYAGNIGLSQGLDNVLRAAELVAGAADIQFVFVGDGAGYEPLQQMARASGLRNLHFFPLQPRERLPEVLATAAISLVSLRSGVGFDSVPSKFYSILSSGRPLVACVDAGSEIWQLTQIADCGICVEPENPTALAGAILSLYRDSHRRDEQAGNGRAYVLKEHSRAAAARAYHEAVCLAAGGYA